MENMFFDTDFDFRSDSGILAIKCGRKLMILCINTMVRFPYKSEVGVCIHD